MDVENDENIAQMDAEPVKAPIDHDQEEYEPPSANGHDEVERMDHDGHPPQREEDQDHGRIDDGSSGDYRRHHHEDDRDRRDQSHDRREHDDDRHEHGRHELEHDDERRERDHGDYDDDRDYPRRDRDDFRGGYGGPPFRGGRFFRGGPPGPYGPPRGGPGGYGGYRGGPPGGYGGRGFGQRGSPMRGYPPRGGGGGMWRGPPGGMPPFRGPPGMPPYGRPYGGPGPYPGGPAPGGMSQTDRLRKVAGCLPHEELWVETKTAEGKSYFYHAVNRETIWEKPDDAKIVSQEELAALVQKVQEEEKAERERGPPMGMPPMGMPGMGGPPGPGHGMPPMGYPPMGMPYGGGAPGMGPPGGPVPPMARNPDEAWQEFAAPDGRKYYYNSITQENTWDKPKALIEKENVAVAEAASGGATNPQQVQEAHLFAQKALAQVQAEVQNKIAEAQAEKARRTEEEKRNQTTMSTIQNNQDKSRPVSSTPVSGTPWCVVWTGDNKVFFYNPSTKTSVWERPPELYGRADVDPLVREPPKAEKTEEPAAPSAPASDGGSGEESDGEGGPPTKKSRQEKKLLKQQLQQKIKEKSDRPRQMLEKPVDPAVQAELQAQQERNKLPLEDRLRQFKEMLIDKDINTNSTFEKELSKIVFDPRYLLLSATERRAAFDAYVKEKTELERAEKKKRAKEAREKFQEMLKESDLHGKSSFSSFASKNGKDPRFKGVEKMREREDLFNEYVGELHKKEKEERKEKKEKSKKAFVTLLEEQKGLTRKSKWREVKKTIEDEERYKDKYLDSSLREDLFKDFVSKLGDETQSDAEEEAEREKRLATEAAIAKRQEEVDAELGEKLIERKKESEKHKQAEHEENFKALCNDLIKSADMSWHDARRVLRKDERYSECDLLDKEAKEKLFEEHIRVLEKRRRELFRKLLDDHEEINTQTRWKDARKTFEKEEIFQKVLGQLSERKVEREYRDWVEERHDQAVKDFKDLLKETKIITYESKKKVEDSEQHLKDILAVLEKDKRYLVMKDNANERDKILDDYIEKLAKAGPPPPPTQQEGRR